MRLETYELLIPNNKKKPRTQCIFNWQPLKFYYYFLSCSIYRLWKRKRSEEGGAPLKVRIRRNAKLTNTNWLVYEQNFSFSRSIFRTNKVPDPKSEPPQKNKAVFWNRSGMFLGLQDPDPDPSTSSKKSKNNLGFWFCDFFMTFHLWRMM
jgi:hypothetical protein